MRRLAFALSLCTLAAATVPTRAAEIVVHVTDPRGHPAADAIVTARPVAATAAKRGRAPPARKTIDQQDETFVPYVEVFAPGDSVVFANSDATQHHAYSFSAAKAFEFVLRPGEQSEPLALEQTGVVAVGCNIHDRMVTYLYVTDAPHTARTAGPGIATLRGLAAGTWRVEVWHPQLKPGRTVAAREVVLGDDRTAGLATFEVPLLPDPRRPRDRERAVY